MVYTGLAVRFANAPLQRNCNFVVIAEAGRKSAFPSIW